jgi:tRNA pseudouridine38-40 synthase
MANMRNIAVHLMYDGTNYHGWQMQKTEKTVAGTVEEVLSKLCEHPVKVHGCGRTDAGVHAKRYCFNFKSTTNIPPERLPLALNSLLPNDISAQKSIYAPDDFDANLSCIKKEYTYKIFNSRIRDPFYSNRAYFYPQKLNIDAMQEASKHFVGTHDFAAVRSVGTETKTTIRTVFWFDVDINDNNIIEMRVCADGFLYNMARAMVGTLLYVSEGKILPGDIPGLLKEKDRSFAGPTVPPGGLYLSRIWYNGDVGKMMLPSDLNKVI